MNNPVAAYVLGIVVSILFLAISAIVSVSIKYEGGSNPRDKQKRKKCFWIFCVINVLVVGIVGFVIASSIHVRSKQADFQTAVLVSMGVSLIVYIMLGFVLSKMFKNGKLGHWF